jgi:splicing factor U2AF subunit
MAEQLARIFGTEEDRVNCPFYFKIGACRNGDQCNRLHNRPTMSQTLLLSHMYPNTPESLALANDEPWDDDMYDRAQQHLEAFYVEVFLELANYGEIEDLVVVDNLCDHMIGNVYVKYYHEEDAERSLMKLTGRFYSGKLIQAEYTTVSDFREARCRAFHETRCNRGAYCNFMHIKHIPRAIKRRVVREMYDDHPEYLGQTKGSRKDKEGKDKDKDRKKDRSRSRRRDKEKKGDRDRDRDRDRRDGEGGGGGAPPAGRQTSEERRAMIAQWNQDREGGGGGGGVVA